VLGTIAVMTKRRGKGAHLMEHGQRLVDDDVVAGTGPCFAERDNTPVAGS
jgi:hypothetical protein